MHHFASHVGSWTKSLIGWDLSSETEGHRRSMDYMCLKSQNVWNGNAQFYLHTDFRSLQFWGRSGDPLLIKKPSICWRTWTQIMCSYEPCVMWSGRDWANNFNCTTLICITKTRIQSHHGFGKCYLDKSILAKVSAQRLIGSGQMDWAVVFEREWRHFRIFTSPVNLPAPQLFVRCGPYL